MSVYKACLISILLCAGCAKTVPDPPDTPPDQKPPVTGKADDVTGSGVPYFYQYDNLLHPGSSCQNTSIAMVLSYLGWEGVPDDITSEWGKDYAQSPGNLNYLFNTLSNEHWLGGALWTTTEGSLEEFRSAASQDNIIIVHGYFTGYGHVLVVTGFDGENYRVNDPAGQWNLEFRGGYGQERSDGRDIMYPKEAFESAISTSDGVHFLPLWYHVLRIMSR